MPRKGRTVERGYGARHTGLRAWWAPRVKRGTVHCTRCGQLIRKGQPWDLGHDDTDPTRTRYRGVEHASCNRSAGARSRGRVTPTPAPPAVVVLDAPIEADRW